MAMRVRFQDWSIKTKIIGAVLCFTAGFMAVLFVLYAAQVRRETVSAFAERARVITLAAESARNEMESNWDRGVFNIDTMRRYAEQGDREKLLAMVPVVTAWRTAMRRAEEGNYTFKTPKFSPRQPRNQPDALETRALKAMTEKNLVNYEEIDPTTNSIRFFRAVRLSKTCLYCHGDPATSKQLWGNDKGQDPLGGQMENWKEGEVHGAFEVIYSLDPADRQVARALMVAGGITLAVLFLGAVIATMLGRGISRPIRVTLDNLKRTARGDFSARLDPRFLGRHDEIGDMFREVDQMNRDLSGTVAKVVHAADAIAQATKEISAGNQDLSRRVQQQAAAVEETAATIEQMTGSVKQNAENSGLANDLASRTAKLAGQGDQVVKEAVEAMGKVQESSRKINDIIGVVNEIAFQTNLLALNAAVEAARAGEAGRGFAVVAGEVRNLAQRSSQAAKEIQSLIKDSVAKVDQGNQLVTRSGETLVEILQNVQRVAETVSDITTSSREQASAIEQVNQAVTEMDESVQQNAALVEQTASASENMANEAQELRAMTAQFHLADDALSVPAEPARPRQLPGPGASTKARPAAKKPAAGQADGDDDFLDSGGDTKGFEKY